MKKTPSVFLLLAVIVGLGAAYILSLDRGYDPHETWAARYERLSSRYHRLTWSGSSELRGYMKDAANGDTAAKIKIGDLYLIRQLSFNDLGIADCMPGPCKKPFRDVLPEIFTYSNVRKDSALALKWYLEAAETGDPKAQIRVGEFYSGQSWNRKHPDRVWNDSILHGEFDTQDNDAIAMKWFRMAADQGDTVAQSRIAHMYKDGTGTPQNYAEAYFWFSLASIGNKYAVGDRDKVAANLTADEIAEVKKRVIAWKPTKG